MNLRCSLLISERKVQVDSILGRLKESYSFQEPYLEKSALLIASLKDNFPLRLNSLIASVENPKEFLVSLLEIISNEYPSYLSQLKKAINKYHEHMELYKKFTEEDIDLPVEYSWSLAIMFYHIMKQQSLRYDILDLLRKKDSEYKCLMKSIGQKSIEEIQDLYKEKLDPFDFDFTELVRSSIPFAPVKTSYLCLSSCQFASRRLINFDD